MRKPTQSRIEQITELLALLFLFLIASYLPFRFWHIGFCSLKHNLTSIFLDAPRAKREKRSAPQRFSYVPTLAEKKEFVIGQVRFCPIF
jgi:hypothetical protein